MKPLQKVVHGGMMAVVMFNALPVMAQQAVQIQDGKDVTLGSKADAACPSPTTNTCTVNSLQKAMLSAINAPIPGQSYTASIGGVGVLVQQGAGSAILEVCGTYTTLSINAGATSMQIIGTASGNIRICDFDISNNSTAGTAIMNFVIGTGANCATNSSQLGQAWYMAAAWAKAAMNPYYRGLNSSAVGSSALCVKTSATTQVDVGVYYDRI